MHFNGTKSSPWILLLLMFVLAQAVNAANNVLVVCHTIMLKQEISSDESYEYNLLEEKYVNDRHRCHMNARFGVFVDENHGKLHTLYWLPRILYKSRFIANSSSCPTTELFIFFTFCLTAKKITRGMVKNYLGL